MRTINAVLNSFVTGIEITSPAKNPITYLLKPTTYNLYLQDYPQILFFHLKSSLFLRT